MKNLLAIALTLTAFECAASSLPGKTSSLAQSAREFQETALVRRLIEAARAEELTFELIDKVLTDDIDANAQRLEAFLASDVADFRKSSINHAIDNGRHGIKALENAAAGAFILAMTGRGNCEANYQIYQKNSKVLNGFIIDGLHDNLPAAIKIGKTAARICILGETNPDKKQILLTQLELLKARYNAMTGTKTYELKKANEGSSNNNNDGGNRDVNTRPRNQRDNGSMKSWIPSFTLKRGIAATVLVAAGLYYLANRTKANDENRK